MNSTEENKEDKKKTRTGRWQKPLIGLSAGIVILGVLFFWYVSDYYRADEKALAAMDQDETDVSGGTDKVCIEKEPYGFLFDGPGQESALIFYPGAKVEEKAYAPLLRLLASGGMDVCLVKMPFRLALFNMDAASEVMGLHDYGTWYIGGHSLGGAIAARYAADHPEKISGLILLAAYATKKIPDTMRELLLVGSEDKVINRKRLEEGRVYAPDDYSEHILQGGNHAQFGSYGEQKGDGEAKITDAEQIQETVRTIVHWQSGI